MSIKGLGVSKTTELQAVFELGRRIADCFAGGAAQPSNRRQMRRISSRR